MYALNELAAAFLFFSLEIHFTLSLLSLSVGLRFVLPQNSIELKWGMVSIFSAQFKLIASVTLQIGIRLEANGN